MRHTLNKKLYCTGAQHGTTLDIRSHIHLKKKKTTLLSPWNGGKKSRLEIFIFCFRENEGGRERMGRERA